MFKFVTLIPLVFWPIAALLALAWFSFGINGFLLFVLLIFLAVS